LSSRFKALLVLAVLAVSLTAAAGCGGGNDNNNNASTTNKNTSTTSTTKTSTTPSKTGGATKLTIAADPSGALKFDKSKLNAKSGNVTITMDNPSPVPHAVGIKGSGVTEVGSTVNKGGVSKATANLKPGTYEFYCPVDGHEQAGMTGTLTVK
jgi:uncharacterized cupredoxin-like copper-binding protein